jgi:hypothetical protein
MELADDDMKQRSSDCRLRRKRVQMVARCCLVAQGGEGIDKCSPTTTNSTKRWPAVLFIIQGETGNPQCMVELDSEVLPVSNVKVAHACLMPLPEWGCYREGGRCKRCTTSTMAAKGACSTRCGRRKNK